MIKERIKIVYIINSFALGGAERLLLDICQRLDKEKFQIAVCSATSGGPLAKDFEALNIAVKVFAKKGRLGLGLIWRIYKFLKEQKPQIVHTHLFGGDTWGRIAAILARAPIIISTEHNINLDEPGLKKKIKWLLSWPTDKIIAVSQSVKDYAVKADKIKPEKIDVIYNGIDLQKFAFRGYQAIEKNNKIKAVVLARLEPQKGHEYLLEALPLLIEKYPDFVLNIIGCGSLEKKLKNQAKDLNLGQKVVFWGRRLDPENILPQMDFFILPSLWEGLGIAILEAQAVGLPVLASKTGGIPEIIEDGKTGLLFEPANPPAIFAAIDKLLSNQELAEKMVKNAYQQVNEKFNLSKMVKAYEKLYLDLINKRK